MPNTFAPSRHLHPRGTTTRRRPVSSGLASEDHGTYDIPDHDPGDRPEGRGVQPPRPPHAVSSADPTHHPEPRHPVDPVDPSDLPILDQVPLLGGLLEDLRTVDRLIANVIDTLTIMQDTGIVEATTGLDIDHWLAIVARRTGADIRMLHTCVAICRRIPALAEAFRNGQISWAQTRTLVLVIHRLPRALDDAIDDALGAVLQRATTTDPDDLVHVVRQSISSITLTDHTPAEPVISQRDGFLALQPRLDGTGD